jgi:transposase-like protein
MVAAVRRRISVRRVAKQFRVARSTVWLWVQRARGQQLDRVDWCGLAAGPRRPANKTPKAVEDTVLSLRRELKECSALGEFGAAAIHRELVKRRVKPLPSVRTVGRVLERRGALDGRRRTRRKAPPAGWYLHDLAGRKVELDSFDIVEGLVIKGGYNVEVLNGVSLYGGLVASWPRSKITAKMVVDALIQHWRHFGLPAYAQFDNDTVFQGPHQHPDTIGRVTRLCLSLGITPVFTPPQETGFQASIENFNGRWQDKVWARFTFDSRQSLQAQSAKFITASRRRAAERIEAAPTRRPFPESWTLNLHSLPQGKIFFLRRSSDRGDVNVLGHRFPVDPNWPHRLVRVEVDLQQHSVHFYALRRRDPTYQPLLKVISHAIPKRKFKD